MDDGLTDKQRAVSEWLKQQGAIADISEEEHAELKKLLGMRGFGLFWAIIMRDRLEAAIRLSNVNLRDQGAVASASVLQGQLRYIESLRLHILHIADPGADAPAQQAKGTNE